MSLFFAVSAILLTAPQTPPKDNVGALPGGNIGNVRGGNVGSLPRGDMGALRGDNIARALRGNVRAAPKGNVRSAPEGNVHKYSRGNLDSQAKLDPRVPKTKRWGFDPEFPSRWGDDAEKKALEAKLVRKDPTPREETKGLNFVAPKGASELIAELQTARLTLNNIDFAFQGRRALAELQVANAIELLRSGRNDPRAASTVVFGENLEGRTSADSKMLAARAKLAAVYAKLRTNDGAESEPALKAVKRSLDSIDAALATP